MLSMQQNSSLYEEETLNSFFIAFKFRKVFPIAFFIFFVYDKYFASTTAIFSSENKLS